MQRFITNIIGLAFLGYGLLRLGVGSLLAGQELGFYHFEFFDEPLADIKNFLVEKQFSHLIPFSVLGYASYIAFMGALLTIGSINHLRKKNSGLIFLGAFLIAYALLFVNFMTINQKIWHLIVCSVLVLILLWTTKRAQQNRLH